MILRSSPRRPRPTFGWGRLAVSAVLTAFLLLTLVRAFVVDVYSVPSSSMEPTLSPGDRLVVLTWPWQRDARPDDVVVFDARGTLAPRSPEGPTRTLAWLLGRNAGDQYVKRVVAVGPARVECRGGSAPVLVDGAQPPVAGAGNCGERPFAAQLPEGGLWLMGDNRDESHDSRDLLGAPGGGSIPQQRVVGRVLWVIPGR